MQIGIDASRALRHPRTGTERYALEITRALLALPQRAAHCWRLYVDRIVDPPTLLPAPENHPESAEIRVLDAQKMWTHRVLGPEVRQRAPDVLFVPAHVVPFGRRSPALPPTVVTIHDLGFRHFPDAHTRRQRWYLEMSTRWSIRAATAVICVSQATARDVQTAYGTQASKLHVVHEAAGPRPALMPPQQADSCLRDLGLERPFALFLGTIQPRKNLRRMIQAYAELVAHHQIEWDLVLAGQEGWLSSPILTLPRELGLADRVHFAGYVDEAVRRALLQRTRFFCFPSLYEGFGLPVLEAQQMGAPVMTSTNSSLPEVAGDAALLVDPTDVEALAAAMLRLSRDEALRQELIAAGYENVKRFSWEKAAAETLAVLEAAAQTGATPAS